MMDIKFVFKNEITEAQQIMINVVNKTCFGFDETEIDEKEGNMFAVEFGAYLLLDDTKIVGVSYLYKKLSEYDGQPFYIGGFGGLGILPDYRGNGYARQLVKKSLHLASEVGVDIACLFTDPGETVYKLYEKFGFAYLNREAYYFDSLGVEKVIDDVMILGLGDKILAKKILSTNHKLNKSFPICQLMSSSAASTVL